MHFCCTPPPLPFPHLVASPVRMMSLTAVNTVSMETPTTALAYISGSSPSILQHPPPPPTSHTLRPLLATQPISPLVWWEQKRGGWRVVGGLTAVDRKNVMVRKTKTTLKKKKKKKSQHWTGLGGGCPLRFRCAQLLILESEWVLLRLKLVPSKVSLLSSIGIYMNICIYSCCAVGREQQQLTCSQRALVSMFLIIIII